MNQQTQQPQISQKATNSIFQALSVLLIGLLISLSILLVSGVGNDAFRAIRSTLPKFGTYNSLKDISNYQDEYSVFSSQPELSYNSKAKILFVESSDFNCLNCGKFYGYQSVNGQESSFSKIKIDYIETGKINYTFVDDILNDNIDKSNALYCVGEQDPKLYFEFKDKLFQHYNEKFDLGVAKNYINRLFGFDNKKFEDCYNSKKYKDRIENLSTFSANTLGSTNTPTYYLFLVEDKDIINTDGTKISEKQYTKLDTINGNVDYDLSIKPKLDYWLEQYK